MQTLYQVPRPNLEEFEEFYQFCVKVLDWFSCVIELEEKIFLNPSKYS